MSTPTKEDIIKNLKTVLDPEMHIDVYSLGLIYDIEASETAITILMTLTTPFCPYADEIVNSVKDALAIFDIPASVNITFEPEWVPPPELRIALGL